MAGGARYRAAMANALLVSIGERVRGLRTEAGQNQAEFAEAAGLHPKYLSRLERGEQNVTVINLGRVARGFGLTMSALLEGIVADTTTLDPKPRANARVRPPAGGPG